MSKWNDVGSLSDFVEQANRDQIVVIRPILPSAADNNYYIILHSRDPDTQTITRYSEDLDGANQDTVQNRATQIRDELQENDLSSEQRPWA